MNPDEEVQWLFAVEHVLSGVIDQQLGTIEDEEFLILWWNDIRRPGF